MEFNIISDGNTITCDILFTFNDSSNNINYIVYTDGTKDDDGELKIYASRYIIENKNFILKSIENDYEWNLIDNMIESKCKKVD